MTFPKITKKKLLIVISIVIFILSIIWYARKQQSDVDPVITPGETITEKKSAPIKGMPILDEVIVNSTTKDEIEKKLGEPVSSQEKDGLVYNTYKSNTFIPSRVYYKDDKAVFVRLSINPEKYYTSVANIEKQFGKTTDVLYGPAVEDGFALYVYPEKGFAYYGIQNINWIEQIVYFEPSSTKEFQEKWYSDYSFDPQDPKLEPPHKF